MPAYESNSPSYQAQPQPREPVDLKKIGTACVILGIVLIALGQLQEAHDAQRQREGTPPPGGPGFDPPPNPLSTLLGAPPRE